MKQSTALQPAWPPVDDEDFVRIPEALQARQLYDAQKDELRDLVEGTTHISVGSDTSDTSQRMAALLHNIAGTAAYFGDRGFGLAASRLEQPVRRAFTALMLRPLCMEILAGLGPRVKR